MRDEDFADCYAANRGRRSIPPSQLAKVLLLQYRTGLSDEQAMPVHFSTGLDSRRLPWNVR